MLIVDAHLDLAYNAVRGRDVLRPVAEQVAGADGTPSVGLPDLRAGGVGLICGTLFAEPLSQRAPQGYGSPDEAHAAAWRQIEWYRQQEQVGQLKIVRTRRDVPTAGDAEAPLPTIILLEGADAIREPGDVEQWRQAGLRAVGLAWKRTRYAGGTGTPGPLTDEGRALVEALDAAGIVHDVSHLAEEAFWNLLEAARGPVMASHSNCRSIVPTDRQLSDDMIRALAARGAVIGINLYERFLLPPEQLGHRRAMLADVVRHVRWMCEAIGDARHVGLGSDMDGGFGREHLPAEIASSADLPRLAEALSSAGFGDAEVAGILGGNWLEFFARSLPESADRA